MERVNHVHIVEVGSGSLIGDIDGMLQGEVPYGEGLKLRITGTDPAFVLVIELG